MTRPENERPDRPHLTLAANVFYQDERIQLTGPVQQGDMLLLGTGEKEVTLVVSECGGAGPYFAEEWAGDPPRRRQVGITLSAGTPVAVVRFEEQQ
ncbi:hypothetical protein KCMC57_64240 (plasmid) [Kitasatospora sp. CMC57]|uniref:Uncharacterized protein n=1 Tax=Kitasatospora sp. CMC57 TaxID=3231513 RepID=A0AB33K5I3_9ACTN